MKVFPSNILAIRECFSHMGNHSGYDCLFQVMKKQINIETIFRSKSTNRLSSYFDKLFFKRNKENIGCTIYYNTDSYRAEREAIKLHQKTSFDILHIAYLENNLGNIGKYKKNAKLISTTHQPINWWYYYAQSFDIMNNVDNIITVGKEEYEYLSKSFGKDRVAYIPHGIDTEFFHPNLNKNMTSNIVNILFSGSWFRDIEILIDVIIELNQLNLQVVFHLLYPLNKRGINNNLIKLLTFRNIKWYSGIDDYELQSLYQKADILFLPLIACTANNAILEGMASGLPVVTSDLYNIRNYTDSSFTSYVKIGDKDGYINCLIDLIKDKKQQIEKGRLAREYSLKYSWDVIANEVLDLYKKV